MQQQRNGDHMVEHQQGKNPAEIRMNVCGAVPISGTDAGDLNLSCEFKQAKTKTFGLDTSVVTMILGVIGTIMMLAACLGRGLYFPSDVYGVILLSSGSLLMGVIMLLLLYILRSKKNNALKNGLSCDIYSNEEMKIGYWHMNLNGWIIWPILMMVCYGLHACLGSVSTQGSMNEMLRWSLLAIFALLAGMLASSADGVRWFAAGWQAAGSLLVFSGLLAVCGVLPLPYAVMRTADPEISSAGARLGGLLQYPNAYGAVVGMYALERLAAVARAMARPMTAWRLIAAALPLMPAQAALLLSESRGAWLATGIAAASAFAWQRRGDRLPLLLAMAAPLASAAWLYRQLAAAQLAPAPVPGLLALAGAWAAALLGTLLLCRLWHSGARARAAALTAMALAVTTAAMLAVASTAERLAAGVGTGLSRLRMWRDALELWSGAAWLGHGGDTWRSMFRAIQASPYVGGEVHNGLIDIALDTGLIGLIMICAWFAFTIRNTVKYAAGLMPSVLVFVLHGAMDFDWSFTLVWMLFIWLGAWSYAYTNEQRTATADEHAVIQARQGPAVITNERAVQPSLLSNEFSYQAIRALRTIPWLTALAILIWLGGTVWLAGRNVLAEVEYRLAGSVPQEMIQHKAELEAAFHANPYRPEIAISLSRTLTAHDAEKLLLSSLSHSPAEPRLYQELGKRAAQAGQGAQTGKYFEQAIALNRYDTHIQSAALYWMIHASRQEWAAGYTDRARQTAAAGVRMYELYEQLNVTVAAGKARNDRNFTLDDDAAVYITHLRILASAAVPREWTRQTYKPPG
ncbi:O-antigen ligase [Paenibacillus illinoisensis]|uniref:O-antigen ligase family protein n=1 Tax=Paenibacillus illinoisensis TaxID=59845 RepID=UPI001C8ECFEB|nr:O-antigen ligase family protein [Paenibacillus illinoisensis]MBY0220090.1 O-antigen ligase family protein [Paenibacillus illinoisensis]